MSSLESKEVKDVEMSLDTTLSKYDLDHTFTADDHDKLIEFLKTFDISQFNDKVYLAPRDHLIFNNPDDDTKFEFKYAFGSPESLPFTVSVKNALISGLVRHALSGDKKANRVPVPCKFATSETMKYVISYMNHQNGTPATIIPDPITSKKMKDMLKDEWLVEFVDNFTPEMKSDVKNPEKTMYDSYTLEQKQKVPETRNVMRFVTETLNYMSITCLLYTLCAKYATMIKGVPEERMQGIIDGTYVVAEKKKEKEDSTSEEKKE